VPPAAACRWGSVVPPAAACVTRRRGLPEAKPADLRLQLVRMLLRMLFLIIAAPRSQPRRRGRARRSAPRRMQLSACRPCSKHCSSRKIEPEQGAGPACVCVACCSPVARASIHSMPCRRSPALPCDPPALQGPLAYFTLASVSCRDTLLGWQVLPMHAHCTAAAIMSQAPLCHGNRNDAAVAGQHAAGGIGGLGLGASVSWLRCSARTVPSHHKRKYGQSRRHRSPSRGSQDAA